MAEIKKRVLIVTASCRPNVGGAETYLEDLCRYLRTNGHFVYILTYQPITTRARGAGLERDENLEIHRFSWIGFNFFHKLERFPVIFNFLYLTPYLFLRSFLFMLTHKNRVDVIDAQGLNGAFIAKFLKLVFKKRAVMSTMALYSFKPGSFFARATRWILSSLDKVIAESEESKGEIMAIGVAEDKIAVFNHWVDQDRFKPRRKAECKVKLGWEGKFIVLFVGRAIPIKGAATLVEIARVVDPKIHFAFISDAGPLVEFLESAALVAENIIFVGGVDYPDLYLYYNAANIFVIPSQYEEGVARVMLEALSSGTPVIGSNRGAIPSVLDASVSILVEPNFDELKKAIEFLYTNPEELKKLTNNCRDYAVKHFNLDNARMIVDNY